MRRALWSLPLLSLLIPLAACGPHGKTGIPEGRDQAWSELDESARMEHMAAVVMPRMQAIFQGHDPDRFADFGCATCHGSGASSGDFAMPNKELPRLDASNLYKKHRKESPKLVKLMWKEVEPAMGEALAETYGFDGYVSCELCHIVDNAK